MHDLEATQPLLQHASSEQIGLAPQDRAGERLPEAVLDLEPGSVERSNERVEREQAPVSTVSRQHRRRSALVNRVGHRADQVSARPKEPGKQAQRRLRPQKVFQCLEAHDRVGDAVPESGTALTRFEIGSHQPDSCTGRPSSGLGKRRLVQIDADDNVDHSGQLR